MRLAARRDTNEKALIACAERLGASIYKGPPLDAWAFHRQTWTPVECKRPDKDGWASEYTPGQLRFFEWCKLRGAPWWVWRTPEDVYRDLGAKVSA